MSTQAHPGPAQRAAVLPEPLQEVVMDLVDAVGGLSQAEKQACLGMLATLVKQAAPTPLETPLRHLELVLDEVHTLAAPKSARADLRRVKASRRRAMALIERDPQLLHDAAAQARIPTQRKEN